MRKLISRFFRPLAATASGRVAVLDPGVSPDTRAVWGLYGAVANLNQAMGSVYTTVASNSQTVTATAAAVAGGILNRTGSPGGAVTETSPTAAQIIAALPKSRVTDGTYQFRFKYINNAMGQTTTWTAGTGVTVTGTATIATSAWRDFLVTVDSASAVTFTNIGSGTL
jgi:hypothetical protein